MKKLLIITYFFPPANFAGSFRLYSWANYLYKYGYYPVFITRKFEGNVNNYTNLSTPTSEGIIYEKKENFEVYYLPYKGNMKDRLMARYGKDKLIVVRKIISFFELFFQNFFISANSFKNIYYFSDKLIKRNNYAFIITSGKPYILFKFCKKLNKKYNIPWIADYRDPWSTHPWFLKRGILTLLDNYFERKWVKTASAITTCSKFWSDEISSFVKRPGYVLYNGFEDIEVKESLIENETFTIVHNGSLYKGQDITLFAEAVKQFISSGETKKLKILFIGISIDNEQTERIKVNFKGYEDYIELSERIEKNSLIQIMKQSSLLLLFGHNNFKGWYPIKVFDYLSVQKPILLCPSDNDVLEKLINETKSGFVLNEKDDIICLLNDLYEKWRKKIPLDFNPIADIIQNYSRENQVRNLVKTLDEVSIKEIDKK